MITLFIVLLVLLGGTGLARVKITAVYTPLGARLVIFVCGAVESIILQLTRSGAAQPPGWITALDTGLTWLVVFEAIYRSRRLLHGKNILLYILAVALCLPFLSLVTYFLPWEAVPSSFRERILQYYSDPENLALLFSSFDNDVFLLAIAIALVLISYALINKRLPVATTAKQYTIASWSGCAGGNMIPSKSQTTRLLCASAFLSGAKFRDELLNYIEGRSHGVSPELGVDLRAVASVCQFAKRRTMRFDWFLFTAALVCGLACFADLTIGITAYVLAASAIFFSKTYGENVTYPGKFRRQAFEKFDLPKEFPADLSPEAESAIPQEDQNLIVYTGFSPFVGSGSSLGGWSFVVDVSRAADNNHGPLRPFTVAQIYTAIDERLAELGLNNAETMDFYFVSGREIREDRVILPDILGRPVQRLENDAVVKYVTDDDLRVRRYKCIRIFDWGQELIMSFYLRFSLRGENLYVEANPHLLTPLADRYRRIDALSKPRTARIIGMLVASVIAGPVYGLFTPFILFARFNEALGDLFGGKEKARRRSIEENLQFDYGAGQGFRQAHSSGQFAHYFQKADGDFYIKMLNQSIIDEIIVFLDAHGIDTSELRERQTVIMNSGIIVHGGDVNAESLAVGAGAQAVKGQSEPKKRAKGATA